MPDEYIRHLRNFNLFNVHFLGRRLQDITIGIYNDDLAKTEGFDLFLYLFAVANNELVDIFRVDHLICCFPNILNG
jgi:hypothetical protein